MIEETMMTDEDQAAQMSERVQVLGQQLSGRLRDYISAREPVERRMVEDLRQYHGRYDSATEAQMNDPRYTRSKVFANVTRSKTNAAEARISDMLFPADDRNWDIQPTPVPEIEQAINQGGTGDPMAQMAADQGRQIMEQARDASVAMRDVIDDQLTECQYNIEARRAIHQAAVLGTGVIKGPVIVAKARRGWQSIADPATGQSVHAVVWEQETKPAAEYVDAWNFFPDMSARTIEECEAVFERKFVSKRQLRDLAKRPGYLRDQIRKVCSQEPDETAASRDHLQRLREISGITGVISDSRYELWEYHGPIETDDLRACGCELPEDMDPLEQFDGTVLFVGDVVIFADVNPMETSEWPYAVWNWEEDEACLFGYGVPYLMRTPQRVLNSAWRMLMDNSGVAVGPQIVTKLNKVQPADGSYALTPMKHWIATDPNAAINDVFATFSINSHQSELANIIAMSKQFADEETSLPLMTQGETSNAPQTATGMSIVMNAANVVLRRMVKAFDDMITKPMVTRFYDWNMQFNDEESIKGDFWIDARGTTALLAKELQTQQLMQFAQFYGHPAFAPVLQPKAASILRRIAESLRLPPDEVVPTDQEIEAMQQAAQEAAAQQGEQPQDPRLMAAQMRAEADMARLQHQAQISEQELGMRAQQSEREAQMRMMQLELQRDIEMLKLAATKELTFEQIKAKLAETAIREKGRKELFAAERELKHQYGSGI